MNEIPFCILDETSCLSINLGAVRPCSRSSCICTCVIFDKPDPFLKALITKSAHFVICSDIRQVQYTLFLEN